MRSNTLLMLTGLVARTTQATNPFEEPILQKFNIEKSYLEKTFQYLTPPSTTFESYYINLSGKPNVNPNCNFDDLVCAVTETDLKVDGTNKKLVSQIVHFPNTLKYRVNEVFGAIDGFQIQLFDSKWGDKLFNANIYYWCDEELENDILDFYNWEGSDKLLLQIKGPTGCIKDELKERYNFKNDNIAFNLAIRYFMFAFFAVSIVVCSLKFAQARGYLQYYGDYEKYEDYSDSEDDEFEV